MGSDEAGARGDPGWHEREMQRIKNEGVTTHDDLATLRQGLPWGYEEVFRRVEAEIARLVAQVDTLTRERNEEMARETGEAYDTGFKNGLAENKRRCEAAEAALAEANETIAEYRILAEDYRRALAAGDTE